MTDPAKEYQGVDNMMTPRKKPKAKEPDLVSRIRTLTANRTGGEWKHHSGLYDFVWTHYEDGKSERVAECDTHWDAALIAAACGEGGLLDECVDIADGVNDNGIPEDVQRSKLKIDARMFKIKNWNRKRYGDVKTIEINQQINVLQAQIDAGKMRVIEGKVIDAEDIE